MFAGRHIVGRCSRRMLRTSSRISFTKNRDSDCVKWTLNVHPCAFLAGSEAKAIGVPTCLLILSSGQDGQALARAVFASFETPEKVVLGHCSEHALRTPNKMASREYPPSTAQALLQVSCYGIDFCYARDRTHPSQECAGSLGYTPTCIE